jgi:holo-[acyl-carrier protein] synthase
MTTPTLPAQRPSSASVRVGVDLVRVSEVADAVASFGSRYLDRIYTPAEQAYAEAEPRVRAERLAARFAAKEAVVKVLRPAEQRPEWTSIEIVRDGAGACDVHLTGLAEELAREAGITGLAVSLTHDGENAAATVVAVCGDAPGADQLRDAARLANHDALPASDTKGTS